MYNEIAANKRQTVVLILLFTIVIVLIGWTLGAYFDNPSGGIIVAAIVSVVMTLFGYFQGDSVAIATAGAQPVERRDNPELYNIVENLSIADGVPAPKIYIIPDTSPNAFATGRDPEHASICVTAGLLQIMNRQELEGVLSHELSHVKNYDVRVETLVVVLVGVVLLLSDILLRIGFRGGFRGGRRNNEGGQVMIVLLLLGLVLAILSPLFAQLIKFAVSRQREYLADASGALLTRYPEGLASALQKIADIDQPLRHANHATAHLYLANPFDPHVTKPFEQLFSTHPPIEDRIKRLRAMGV